MASTKPATVRNESFVTTDREGVAIRVTFNPNLSAWNVQYQNPEGDVTAEFLTRTGYGVTSYTY